MKKHIFTILMTLMLSGCASWSFSWSSLNPFSSSGEKEATKNETKEEAKDEGWKWSSLNPFGSDDEKEVPQNEAKEESWKWSSLNPFDGDEKVEEKVTVNPFLWQAAIEKISFLGLEKQDKEQGLLISGWSEPENNERLQIRIWISSDKLRADSLHLIVLKQAYANKCWEDAKASSSVAPEIEKAILKKARILYRNSLVKK